jgi:pimeloyl-ACP methyl ester carboxylesterase
VYEQILARWPAPYEALQVETRFGQAHVNASGPQEAPPLVLLPGNFTSSIMWKDNIAALSRSRRVYAVDMAGEPGKSLATQIPATRADLAGWLADVLDGLHLGVTDLAGLSKGGFLAAIFALEYPERVRALILLCPGLPLAPWSIHWAIRGMPMVLRPTRTTVKWFLAGASTRPAGEVHEAFILGITGLRLRAAPPPALRLDELHRLAGPVLLLVGEQEILYSAVQVVERVRRDFPTWQAECVPGAGHFLNSDQPEIVNRQILAFLEGAQR